MPDNDWRELYYGPVGYRVRWRVEGFNGDGYPYGLKLERYVSAAGEWAPIPNHNVRDVFKMGLMAARNLREQTELNLA